MRSAHLLCTDTSYQLQLAREELAECSLHPACPPCPPRSGPLPLEEEKQQREAWSPALVLGLALVVPQPAPGSKKKGQRGKSKMWEWLSSGTETDLFKGIQEVSYCLLFVQLLYFPLFLWHRHSSCMETQLTLVQNTHHERCWKSQFYSINASI